VVSRKLAFLALFAASACTSGAVVFVPAGSGDNDTDDASNDAAPARSDDGAADALDASVTDTSTHDSAALGSCQCGPGFSCCLPSSAAPFCYPATDASTCAAASGLSLGCVAGENGRECCLAPDRRSSSMVTTCEAGVQMCGDPTECRVGACTSITCRTAQIPVCVSGAPPTCPP
jgi:hypothetical protein